MDSEPPSKKQKTSTDEDFTDVAIIFNHCDEIFDTWKNIEISMRNFISELIKNQDEYYRNSNWRFWSHTKEIINFIRNFIDELHFIFHFKHNINKLKNVTITPFVYSSLELLYDDLISWDRFMKTKNSSIEHEIELYRRARYI